jgi:hypothetical protein
LFFCSLAPSSKVVAVNDSNPDYAAEIPSTPYAKEIATHLNQDHINRITRVIEEIGMSDWLEANPLSRLELTHQVVDEDKNQMNGMYSFTFQTIQVATMRNTSEYGKTFEWQRVYSVSSTGDTPIETVKRTLIHELGHHVHNILKLTYLESFKRTLAVNYFAGGTVYSQHNKIEYFAESFALYVYFHDILRKFDPQGYGMIEAALTQIGLEVNPL